MITSKFPSRCSTSLIALAISAAVMNVGAAGAAQSQWVYPGPDGRLVYKTTPAGDRIMDFSTAGYRGGGVAFPAVPVKQTVQPSGGEDDTAVIQAAIDAVSAMPLEGGFRGAILLAPGSFTCSRTISIPVGGIVLRGSGSGTNGTTIRMTGGRHSAVSIGGTGSRGTAGAAPATEDGEPTEETEPARGREATRTTIADAYVPAGALSFTVADTTGLAVGDTLTIRRPTTAAWVELMQMDTLKRNGRPQTWIGTSRSGTTERRITAISGSKITLDIPLADSYDAKYLNPPGTLVSKIKPSTPLAQVAVEHLHIQCPPLESAYGQAPYSGIRINGEDCWVKDVYCEETMNTTAMRGKRITMQQVVVKHTFPNLGASKPTDFSIEGSQILLDRCRITGDNMYFVWTGSLVPGPNVLLNCTFNGRGSRIQPHQRWSTGMLVDNCRVPDGGIDYANRGVAGSGHGWTMGWAVVWNSLANTYVIQNPPGAANWAIGCLGTRVKTGRYFDAEPILPEGIFDSFGKPVAPQSLYLAQLVERLGPQALRNIGYSSNTRSVFAEKIQRLPALPVDVDTVLGPDLATHRPVNTGNVRDRKPEFAGEKALDGDPRTSWATSDGASRATLEVDLEGPVEINAAAIEEAAGFENRVQGYRIEGMGNSDWTLLAEGTTIGGHKVDRFPKMTAWKVRLTILKADPYAAIRKFGVYMAGKPQPSRPRLLSPHELATPNTTWR